MPAPRLLVFNLATDADDPTLGFTTAWLNALAARCAQVDVITMRAGRWALPEHVRVYSVGKERGYSEARRLVIFYRLLIGLLWRGRYDACFAHMQPLFALLAAPLLKLRRIPLTLWYAHSAVSGRLRWAERMVDRVVTASPESFRIPSHKVRVIGHGVDTNQFSPAPGGHETDRPFTVLSVGRVTPIKSPETLIEAARLLRAERHPLEVTFIGEAASPAYAADLDAQIRSAGLACQVKLAGPVPFSRVAELYQRADVMVNLSRTDSIDKAVLEAMACGLPVITSNEAFHAPLAPWADRLLAPHGDARAVADRLRGLMALTVDERRALGLELRALVVREHSLTHLMDSLLPVLLTGEPG